jgi:hypothetical protein
VQEIFHKSVKSKVELGKSRELVASDVTIKVAIKGPIFQQIRRIIIYFQQKIAN